MKFDFFLTHTEKINSKWIEDLNVRAKTKNLKENPGVNLHGLGLSKILNMTLKAQVMKGNNR